MLACPVCGFRNPDTNERCFRCNALLTRNTSEFEKAGVHAQTRMSREVRRNLWFIPVEWIGRRKFIQTAWAIPDSNVHRFPFTAGLLTILLPGAGHFYLRQFRKGWLFLICWIVLIAVCIFTIREPWSNSVLLLAVLLMAAMWADAVVAANMINGNLLPFRHALALGFAFLFCLGLFFAGLQFFGSNIMSFTKLIVDNHPGYLQRGDRVMVNHLAYLFSDPKPGDMVLYDPQRFTMQKGDDLTSVNIDRYFQQVVGVPGDRVQKVGKTYLRNGKPAPPDSTPIGGDFLPEYDIKVPADSYFIPVTTIPPGLAQSVVSGIPIGYVGEPGYIFAKWPSTAIVKRGEIMGKALAVTDPPTHRKWL
jgi:hypothetical protein